MLINTQGRGVEIYTPQKFTDVRIEMEVMVPKGSNSGIHAMGDSEVQVCDSFEKQNLNGGDVGAIHGASPRHCVTASLRKAHHLSRWLLNSCAKVVRVSVAGKAPR